MKLNIHQALQHAIKAHQNGNLKEAEKLYRAILNAQPQHPDANHNLGIIALQANHLNAGLALIEKAIDINPATVQFWMTYTDALLKAGKTKEARQIVKKARKKGLAKEAIDVLETKIQNRENLSETAPPKSLEQELTSCYSSGNFSKTITLANKLLSAFPKFQLGWKILGAALIQTQAFEEAIKANKQASQLQPEDTDALNNLGISYRLNKQYAEAERAFNDVVKLNPEVFQAYNNLGNLCRDMERFEEAQTYYETAIKLKPDYFEALYHLGDTLEKLNKSEQAIECLKKAIKLNPNYPPAYYDLGISQKRLNRIDEARENFTLAIKLDPKYGRAHRSLSLSQTYKSENDHFKHLVKLSEDESLSQSHKLHIHFALAKAYEDLGHFELAFSQYSLGNKIAKKQSGYSIARDTNIIEAIKKSASAVMQCNLDNTVEQNNCKPIFVLGMPRSGTTLVEQIISSHSAVLGAGELNYIEYFGGRIARGLDEPDGQKINNFREAYLAKLKALSKDGSEKWITDKMPLNFRYIGLISSALPEAKIIHVKRDKNAVCWSNFKHFFYSSDLHYSNDISDIYTYYELYENLMSFWQETVSANIYELNYEELVSNPEPQIQKLINYLELEWEEACLSPQNNERSVLTASNMQVRRGIYQNSSQQWKNYESFLKI